jgi:ParB family chromosome partitioning protein
VAKSRGLGRGLSALIPDSGSAVGASTGASELLAVALIDSNPFQPRKRFDDEPMAELVDSVRVHGIIQPVVVRPVDGRFQVVAGERRVRAARLVGLSEIPVVVRELSDRDAMELALVENLQRADLNPIEECEAYARLMEEFGWTQEEIGARVGKSRSHIANYLRLRQLPDDVLELVGRFELSVAHAKVLLSAPEERRSEFGQRCVREGWTVRMLEAAVKRGAEPVQAKPQRALDVHLKGVETGLRRKFGTRVVVRGDSQKGRIEIPYRSLEELERIIELLNGNENGMSEFPV